jgi:hypothetical protein
MAEIWNGENIREMRRDLVQGTVPAACAGAACQVLAGLKARQSGEMAVKT